MVSVKSLAGLLSVLALKVNGEFFESCTRGYDIYSDIDGEEVSNAEITIDITHSRMQDLVISVEHALSREKETLCGRNMCMSGLMTFDVNLFDGVSASSLWELHFEDVNTNIREDDKEEPIIENFCLRFDSVAPLRRVLQGSNSRVERCETNINLDLDGYGKVNSSITTYGPGKVRDVEVYVNMEHHRLGDIEISLQHVESGKEMWVLDKRCGSGKHLRSHFNDGDKIFECYKRSSGEHLQGRELFRRFDDEKVATKWTLKIDDTRSNYGGKLKTWCIEYTPV